MVFLIQLEIGLRINLPFFRIIIINVYLFQDCKKIKRVFLMSVSSNGRTAVSKTAYLGSNPCAGAKCLYTSVGRGFRSEKALVRVQL